MEYEECDSVQPACRVYYFVFRKIPSNVRWPNFLNAKLRHVPNFRVRSGDKCVTQTLRYLCFITVPSHIQFRDSDQRSLCTQMVLGACKIRLECNVPQVPCKITTSEVSCQSDGWTHHLSKNQIHLINRLWRSFWSDFPDHLIIAYGTAVVRR